MKQINIHYHWSWETLSLFKKWDHEPFYSETLQCTCVGGGTKRVFTLWPKFLWWGICDWWHQRA